MKQSSQVPNRLYIIRHARSLANEKLVEAEEKGDDEFRVETPEPLTPIVEEGRQQARRLALWFAGLADAEKPGIILSSTHLRSRQTAEELLAGSLSQASLILDRRFIERRWGILANLTSQGFLRRYPAEATRWSKVGDFRYRPPKGGESLRDLRKRLAPALKQQLQAAAGSNLALVTHSQVILVLRHLLEGLSEKDALRLYHEREMPNCSVCVYVRQGKRLVLEKEYFVAP